MLFSSLQQYAIPDLAQEYNTKKSLLDSSLAIASDVTTNIVASQFYDLDSENFPAFNSFVYYLMYKFIFTNYYDDDKSMIQIISVPAISRILNNLIRLYVLKSITSQNSDL